MWELQACTVCFSTGVKLYSLNVGTLRNDFNSLSGLKMVEGNGLPQYLCVECTAHVTKFKKFREKCHRAHYALKQMLYRAKEIKMSHIKNFNRSELNILPSLSYMNLDRTHNYRIQFKLVSYFRKGVPEPPSLIPVTHCNVKPHEDGIDFDKRLTRDDDVANIKTESKLHTELNQDQIAPFQEQTELDLKQGTEDSIKRFKPNQNGLEVENVQSTSVKSIIKQALDMVTDKDDIFNHDNDDNMHDSGGENESFELMSCHLTNKVGGVKTTDDYGDIVPISFKEAKAAYEVYKYCSQGKYKCYCGKSCESEQIFELHCRLHNTHVSGRFRCEICDVYYKTSLLLEVHMSDKHMYKYLCKLCPEVNFSKKVAKAHYMSHINPSRDKRKRASKKAARSYDELGRQKTRKSKASRPNKRKPLPEDFLVYSPQSQEEQYRLIQQRKNTRNYMEAKFRCELCFRGFRLTITYNKHMAKHDSSVSGSHQCDMCQQYFRNTRVLYKHMVMYHTRKYSCQHCDFVTTNKGQALMHYKWHKNVTYDCPHCGKKFNKISTQLTHIRFKHPSTDICNMCGHSFVSSSGLNCHKISTHTKKEIDTIEALSLNPDTSSPLYCKECRMQFASELAYNTHLGSSKKHVETNISSRSMMTNIRRISRAEGGIPGSYRPKSGADGESTSSVSPMVGKGSGRGRKSAGSLPGSTVLNTGVTTATNCEVCGVYLASDVLARRHYETEHPGTNYLKRYMCDICGHTTRQYANLLVHMRTHTREKPYECPYCDRRFSMTSNRDRHLVVHTGEKRYQCQHCSRRFTQSTAVKLHIQTVHMKIPYKPWEKKNRKRRKDAQINTAGVQVTEEMATSINTNVIPLPQHKLLIGDPQGEYITYISYAQEQ